MASTGESSKRPEFSREQPTSRKSRLYVTVDPLVITQKDDSSRLDWGFFIGPKHEAAGSPGTLFRLRTRIDGSWAVYRYPVDDITIGLQPYVRILIAKITNENRLVEIIKTTPLGTGPQFHAAPWVADVLRAIKEAGDVVGTSNLDWHDIQVTGMNTYRDFLARGYYEADKLLRARMPVDLLPKPKSLLSVFDKK